MLVKIDLTLRNLSENNEKNITKRELKTVITKKKCKNINNNNACFNFAPTGEI